MNSIFQKEKQKLKLKLVGNNNLYTYKSKSRFYADWLLFFCLQASKSLHIHLHIIKVHISGTNIETDSYIAVQLIDKQNTLNFKNLKYMAEKIEGSFCFTVLSKDNELYFVKGDNPMCIAHFNGFYIYASTKEILTKTLKKLGLKKYKEVSIKEGEILKINADGSRERDEFNMNYCYGYRWYDYGGRSYYYGYDRKKNKEFTDEYFEELDALCVINTNLKIGVSPIVYINQMYEEYRKNKSLPNVLKTAADTISNTHVDINSTLDCKNLRENTIFVLVNAEDNKAMLSNAPHKRFLDLAIVFRWLI